ncbi:MAG TPA: hypothetical protein VN457_07550 [Chlamydiales bacterium]|nr:hypothetical protein [Chlamydiales bacterium]
MGLDLLSHHLERHGIRAELSLNDNRHIMLTIRRQRGAAKVSLHRMFLEAPNGVLMALAEDIRIGRRRVSKEVRLFIEESRGQFDYAHRVNRARLEPQGSTYNLAAIYEKLNTTYFSNQLDLQITYFGHSAPKNSSRCSLGLYYDSLKLIKIHRILDKATVPEQVIEFVVYHEMVHAISPPHMDEKGTMRIHNSEFKHLEKQFQHYKEAQNWLKKNKLNFFFDAKTESRKKR